MLFSLSIAGAPSLPPWDIADIGSEPCDLCIIGKPRAAEYDEAADVDPFPCPASPKLPDLECPLASLEPPADRPAPICNGGRPLG